MVIPMESKPIHTVEKLQLRFLTIVHIPLKTPSATYKGECEWFYLWQRSDKRNQIVNCSSYPVQWKSRSLNSTEESYLNTINLTGTVMITYRQFKNWVV